MEPRRLPWQELAPACLLRPLPSAWSLQRAAGPWRAAPSRVPLNPLQMPMHPWCVDLRAGRCRGDWYADNCTNLLYLLAEDIRRSAEYGTAGCRLAAPPFISSMPSRGCAWRRKMELLSPALSMRRKVQQVSNSLSGHCVSFPYATAVTPFSR